MKNTILHKIKTIAEYHQFTNLPGPEHPLISVINFEDVKRMSETQYSFTLDFYSIALKRDFNAKMKYGQQEYDFDEGLMVFISPGQVLTIETTEDLKHSGCLSRTDEI
jgi:hypothetical protein